MLTTSARDVSPIRQEVMLFLKILLGFAVFSLPLSLPLFIDYVNGLAEPSVIQYGKDTKPVVWESYEQGFKIIFFLSSAPAFFVAFIRLMFSSFITKDQKKRNAILYVGFASVAIYWTLKWIVF